MVGDELSDNREGIVCVNVVSARGRVMDTAYGQIIFADNRTLYQIMGTRRGANS